MVVAETQPMISRLAYTPGQWWMLVRPWQLLARVAAPKRIPDAPIVEEKGLLRDEELILREIIAK